MYYITVNIEGVRKVVATGKGTARIFAKRKKADNFLNGRLYLQKLGAIIVESTAGTEGTYKVEL